MSFEEAIREFNLTLDEVDSNLRFLQASARLRPRLNPLLNWTTLSHDKDAKQLAEEFLRQKEVDLTYQYRGMIVVLSGAFERTIRRIVEDAIGLFSSTQKGFDSIPHSIRVQNVTRTGRALAKSQEPLDHTSVDYHSLVENLATCKPGAAKFYLNKEVFSIFISSITPSHLEEILSWMDTRLDWDEFGRCKDLEAHFGTKGVRATGKAISGRLSEFTKLRNNIAHGGGNPVVTEIDVEGYIYFFRSFIKIIAELIATRLKAI